MIDFNKLSRPKSTAAPLDPLEIFAKTPNTTGALNELWKGQAEALTRWHKIRGNDDNAILLNTGAGKTIVGLLIAQSLVNENIGPVIFTCSTIDLVEQTARECDRLGLKYTNRISGSFSNDLFETGRAFCLTTYQALFTANTTFSKEKSPAAVIFDDAHVGERAIRDVFTLSINKERYRELFQKIVEMVRPEFESLGKGPHLSLVLEASAGEVTMCPPATASRCSEQILEGIRQVDHIGTKKVGSWRDTELFFPALRLWEHINKCAIFISASEIEITPPFIPTGAYKFLTQGVRRIYLSATLDFETDFARGFGVQVKDKIAPDNDAGNGERLILLSSRMPAKIDRKILSKEILKTHKLLVSVPSYSGAVYWKEIGEPPPRPEFSKQLNDFRLADSGAFILVSRIDGIDLPQDTCRVMLIDGAPSGSSLMERYLYQYLSLSNLYSTKMASRITQLLGRINRARSDYGAFIIFGSDVNIWLKTERNLALLPELIRKQFILGQGVQEGMDQQDEQTIAALIRQVIPPASSNGAKSVVSRDNAWLEYYRDTIDGLDVPPEELEKVKLREAALAVSAVAECEFMTKLWQGDQESARTTLTDVLDSTAIVDAKLAGWYSVWLGASYESAGDLPTALYHYKRARTRLSVWLNVPYKNEFDEKPEIANATSLQKKILSVNHHGAQALGDLVSKMKIQSNNLTSNLSSNVKEESLRYFGELIGFSASRPDNDLGHGPDVIWIDEEENEGVAFELKTEKNEPAEYKKSEIGQALNHMEWLRENHSDIQWRGLLIVGPDGVCKSDASPSDELFLTETVALAERMNYFAAKIADIRGRIVIERYTILKELAGLAEWQPSGWFRSLATVPMKSLKGG